MSFILRALLSFSREEGRRLTRAAAQAGLAGLSTWVLTAFWTGALPAPTPLTLVLAARWPPSSPLRAQLQPTMASTSVPQKRKLPAEPSVSRAVACVLRRSSPPSRT